MPVVQHVDVDNNGNLHLESDELTRLTVSSVLQYSPYCETSSPGTLVVTNRRVVWLNFDAPNKGSSYQFRDISMHAIASDSFDKPCLYCHLDTEEVTEIRFVPENSSQLQQIYEAFCQGAMDNPDLDEEEPCDAWISAAMEDEVDSVEDDAIEGQFDDA